MNREETAKIIKACPDSQWRLIVALARIGALRVPSELLALRWKDVDFAAGTMVVRSPKTEHHEGKDHRVVPIFPELRPFIDEARELAESRAEYVITRYRHGDQNLRTTFQKIIVRAGLTPWPKLFVNMRASRATELVEHFPGYLAAAWLGHSEKIADTHYRQTTDAHVTKATTMPTGHTLEALQGALQSAAESDDTCSHRVPGVHATGPYLPVPVICGGLVLQGSMGDEGCEPTPDLPKEKPRA